jgi:hypothetical protein
MNSPLEISSEFNLLLPTCCNAEDNEDDKIEKILELSKIIWKKIIKYNIDTSAGAANASDTANTVDTAYAAGAANASDTANTVDTANAAGAAGAANVIDNTDILLSNLQIEYSDFFKSFPLILRWMVQMKQFKIKVFKEYLKIFINKKISSKIEFLQLQGDYIVMLYKELNPLCSKEQLNKYESDIVNLLLKEDSDFKEIEEEAKKEIESYEKILSEERKMKLYNMLVKKSANSSN